MKNRNHIILLIFVFLIFLVPFSVWAEPSRLTIETTISNWKPYNSLYINPSPDMPEGVSSTWYLRCDGDNIYFPYSSGYVFREISQQCTTAVFVEELDISSYDTSNLGLHNFSITPALFDQNVSLDINDASSLKSYVFNNYDDDVRTIQFFVLNEVDADGNIVGNPYIRDFYFVDREGQKETSVSLGSVIIPNFTFYYRFLVKGNIAKTNGTFHFSYLNGNQVDEFYEYVLNGEMIKESSDWSLTDLRNLYVNSSLDFMNVSYELHGDDSGSEYSISFSENTNASSFSDALQYDGNEVYLECLITAENSVDSSDTGLFYNIMPFLFLLIFGGLFVLFFLKRRKNAVKVIVDDELL